MSAANSERVDLPTDGLTPAEVAALQAEIEAELADHLACLADDHAIAGGTTATTDAAVRKRFGDPEPLARRLFLDATRERLLMQRLTLGTAAASLLVSLTAIGLLLFVLGRLSGLDRTLDRTDAAVADVAASLDRLNERMATFDSQPVASVADPTYQPVTFLIRDADHLPVAGVRIQLRPDPETQSGAVALRQTSGADGRISFPLVHVGSYDMTLSSVNRLSKRLFRSAGEAANLPESVGTSITDSLLVQPGQPISGTYTLPSVDISEQQFRFEVAAMPPLQEKPAMMFGVYFPDQEPEEEFATEVFASLGEYRPYVRPESSAFVDRRGWYFELSAPTQSMPADQSRADLPPLNLKWNASQGLRTGAYWLAEDGTLYDADPLDLLDRSSVGFSSREVDFDRLVPFQRFLEEGGALDEVSPTLTTTARTVRLASLLPVVERRSEYGVSFHLVRHAFPPMGGSLSNRVTSWSAEVASLLSGNNSFEVFGGTGTDSGGDLVDLDVNLMPNTETVVRFDWTDTQTGENN